MKTDEDLDAIAQAIRDSGQLVDPDYPRTQRRLLRSIQIDALREAREMYVPDGNPFVWARQLDKLIRELELK